MKQENLNKNFTVANTESMEENKMNTNKEKRVMGEYFKYTKSEYSGFTNWEITDGHKSLVLSVNSANQGLWLNGRQVKGTAQFALPTTREATYAKLRRYYLAYRDFADMK